MAREKEIYRDNLEYLSEQYENRPLLYIKDIKRVLNRDDKTLKADESLAKYGFSKRGGKWCITLVGLARYLS